MTNSKHNRLIFEIAVIAVLMICALFIRHKGFHNGGRFTFDEALYAFMAYEMYHDISHYNAINYTNQYLRSRPGKPMPPYLFKKLFKHPPLYCFLILNSYKVHEGVGLFNPQQITQDMIMSQAVWVSILMGAFTVGLVYCIARMIYGIIPALIASWFMVIDPVHWICSQKVWMETTLTFFMALAPFLYILSYRKKDGHPLYFALSGLTLGFAALTKYPGGIMLAAIVFYTLLTRPAFFRRPVWLLVPICMFIILMPWIFRNLEEYGLAFIFGEGKGFADIRLGYTALKKILLASIIPVGAGVALYYTIKKKQVSFSIVKIPAILKNKFVWMAVTGVLILVCLGSNLFGILSALSLKHEPETSWRMLFFKDEPWYFYLKRLFIYSPIYIFAYISPFLIMWKKREHHLLPILCAGVVVVFFIAWGNFQCRYILPAVPWLLVMAGYTVNFINTSILKLENKPLRAVLLGGLWLFVLFAFIKALQIDAVLAWTNKPCYF